MIQFPGLLTRFSTKSCPLIGRGSMLDDVFFVSMEVAVRLAEFDTVFDYLDDCLDTEEIIGTVEFKIVQRTKDE